MPNNPETVISRARRSFLKRTILTAGAYSAASFAGAAETDPQAWPARPVRIVVPFTPGGVADQLSRVVADGLTARTRQTFIVDNKPGAGGTIGTTDVVRSAPDGLTLLSVTPSFVISQYLYKKLPFDGKKDLFPLGMVMTAPLILVVNPSLKIRTLAEFIAAAKSNPTLITFASAGSGTTPHLAGELLKQQAGIEMLHIPYKGGGDALTAVLSGTASCFFGSPTEVGEQMKAGHLIPMGVTTGKRSPLFPEIPTIADSGVPGFEILHYVALMMRSSTPQPIVDQASKAMRDAITSPSIRQRIVATGAEIPQGTLEEAAQIFSRDHERWSRTIKLANITLE